MCTAWAWAVGSRPGTSGNQSFVWKPEAQMGPPMPEGPRLRAPRPHLWRELCEGPVLDVVTEMLFWFKATHGGLFILS